MTKTYEVVRRADGMTIHTGTYRACCEYARRSVVPRAGLVVRLLAAEWCGDGEMPSVYSERRCVVCSGQKRILAEGCVPDFPWSPARLVPCPACQ